MDWSWTRLEELSKQQSLFTRRTLARPWQFLVQWLLILRVEIRSECREGVWRAWVPCSERNICFGHYYGCRTAALP